MKIYCPSKAKEPYKAVIEELSKRAGIEVVFAKKFSAKNPIVLDEKGAPANLNFLKKLIQKPRDFVVGGPDGIDIEGEKISLGNYTLNHQIAIIVLLELLFRMKNPTHPYNKH